MAVLPYSSEQWVRFLSLAGRDDLAAADWVIDAAQRSERIDELYEVLGDIIAADTTERWLSLLARHDVPCARVNELGDLAEDPQLLASGLLQQHEDAEIGAYQSLRSPYRIKDQNPGEPKRAPKLGQHSTAVLAGLGYDEDQIRALVDAGVIKT